MTGGDQRSRRLSVLQVTASVAASDGGPATAILELNRALLGAGIASRIVTTDADGRGRMPRELTRQLSRDPLLHINIHRVNRPRRIKLSVGQVISLRRLVLLSDVVHIHGLYLAHSLSAALLSDLHRVPYVIQPHGSLEPYQRGASRRAKALYDAAGGSRVLRRAAAVVFADETEAERARDLVPRDQSVVVPLGARPPAYKPANSKHGQDAALLFLGRVTPKKRLDLLIDAMPIINKRFPSLRLEIAGPLDPHYGPLMEQRARASTSHERIQFLGPVHGEAKTSLLQRSLMLVLPSENENFAITVVEAMQAGLPVVATSHVAAFRYPLAADAGEQITSMTPDAVAGAVCRVLTRDDLAEMRLRAIDAGADLTWDASAQKLLCVYRAVLRGGKAWLP